MRTFNGKVYRKAVLGIWPEYTNARIKKLRDSGYLVRKVGSWKVGRYDLYTCKKNEEQGP